MKLIVLVAILAIGCGAKAEEIHGVDGVDPKVEAEMKKVAPYFMKLTNEFREKLSVEDRKKAYEGDQEITEKCIEIAKQKLDGLNSIGCIGACLNSKISEKKALALFVSLEKTLGKCDTESYDILARNYLAHSTLEHLFFAIETYQVVNYYRAKHAENCRPVHKQRFAEQVQNVDPESLKRANRALSTLNIHHFGFDGEFNVFKLHYFDLIGMPVPKFVDFFSQKSLLMIAQQIAEQLKDETTERSKLANPKIKQAVNPSELNAVLDEYLFEPCKNYRKVLAATMNEARFDAAVEDGKAQQAYIHGDKKFYEALIANRLCAGLLKDQDKLYPLMSKAWNKMLHPSDNV